ncbi:18655_t:CDS:2, partial [Acaulospora morrowiae]
MRLYLYPRVRPIVKRVFLQRVLPQRVLHTNNKECFVENLEGEDKGISIINLNRPSTKNAFSKKLLTEFEDAVEKLRNGTESRVVLLRSLVDRAFCSGADLK